MKAVFSHEQAIDAPATTVWHILTDTPAYREWNTFTPVCHANLKLGGKVEQHVYFSGSKKPVIHKAVISQFLPGRKLAWKMNWGFLLKAERSQEVIPTGKHKCIYRTRDVNEGLLAFLVKLGYEKKITSGFRTMSQALKTRAEST